MYLVFLSAVSHKEHRFLLPLLQFPGCALIAKGYIDFYCRVVESRLEKTTALNKKVSLAVLLLPQLVAAVFFARVHQRGGEKLLAVLGSNTNR